MKLPHPFVQLPIRFDADRLAAEVAAIEEREWQPHPQGFPGNSMLPMVAVDGDPMNAGFAGTMRPTPYLRRCPYLMQTMAAIGVTIGRSRLMRLAGQAEVMLHADHGYYWVDRARVHVPIITQPTVAFHCDNAVVHMGAGECWIFDTWRLHRVINADNHQRVHLVIDTMGGNEFWRLVEAGRPVPSTVVADAWSPKLLPYKPGETPELPMESANVPDVMTPWEVEAHLSFLLDEIEGHQQKPFIVRHVVDFTRDWRALWARFGARPEGRVQYEQAMRRFLTAVHGPARTINLKNDPNLNLFGAIMTMVATVSLGPATGNSRADMG